MFLSSAVQRTEQYYVWVLIFSIDVNASLHFLMLFRKHATVKERDHCLFQKDSTPYDSIS